MFASPLSKKLEKIINADAMRWSILAPTARRANFHGPYLRRRPYPMLMSGSKAGGRTAHAFLIDQYSWIGATTRVTMGLNRSITDLVQVPVKRHSPQTLSEPTLPKVPLYAQIPPIGFELS